MQAQVKAEAGMAAVAGQATLTSSVAAQAEVSAMQVWVSGFKYRIFLGNGFLSYGLVSSGQPEYFYRCNRVFEAQKCDCNDKILFFSNLLTSEESLTRAIKCLKATS